MAIISTIKPTTITPKLTPIGPKYSRQIMNDSLISGQNNESILNILCGTLFYDVVQSLTNIINRVDTPLSSV